MEQEFKIPMTETLERQVADVCNLSVGVWEQGMEQGIKKGYETAELSAIRNLMQNLKMTAEQAMDALDISSDKREKYHAMIQ